MDKDGEMGIPHEPIFSSPNITPNENNSNSIEQTAARQPEQPVTNTDIAAMAGTDAGAVATAAAALPENDTPVAVSSGNIPAAAPVENNQPVARGRFGLSNRRFRAPVEQPVAPSAYEAYATSMDGNSKPKISKKTLFIGIGAAAAVILAIVLVVVLIPKGGNGTISKKTKELFSSFANYMISGEDKKDEIGGEYEYGSRYHYGSLMDTNERVAYLKAAKEKYASFEKSYDNDKYENAELGELVHSYAEKLDYIYFAEQYPVISNSNLINYFVDHGKRETQSKLEEYYNHYSESSYDKTKNTGNNAKQRAIVLLDAYNSLKINNCINTDTGNITSACYRQRNTASYSGSLSKVDDYKQYTADMYAELSNSSKDVYRDIWRIRKALNNEK